MVSLDAMGGRSQDDVFQGVPASSLEPGPKQQHFVDGVFFPKDVRSLEAQIVHPADGAFDCAGSDREWFFVISCGFQDGTCRAGDQVDHGDEGAVVAVSTRPCAGGLEDPVQPFEPGVGKGGGPLGSYARNWCMG